MIATSVKLGDVLEIYRGGSPRPIENFITEDSDGLNWIKIGDVGVGEKYIEKTKEKIRKEGLSKTRQVYAGDFLLSNSMSFGRPYITKIDGCIHDGWLTLRDTKNLFDKDFLYHLLSSQSVKAQFAKFASGAVVKNLNIDAVSKVTISIPPLAEQKRIAALLDKAENIMRLREQTIAKLDSLVESTFFKLFGNAKNNEMSWNTVPLGDLCDVEWGNTSITKASYVEHGFPAYSAAGSDGYLAHAEHTGDGIVLSAIGARCGKCFRAEGEWTAIKNTITIKTKSDEVDIDFLFQILNDENFWEIRGAGQPFITLGTARKLKVITPPKKLQSKFVNMYEEIKNQRKNFESSHMKLTEAFSSLQHQSFAVN